MLRTTLARLYGRLFGGSDDEGESSAPFAFSRLDRSVNEAHGQRTDAGERAIREVEATAEQLERIDEHQGPPDGEH